MGIKLFAGIWLSADPLLASFQEPIGELRLSNNDGDVNENAISRYCDHFLTISTFLIWRGYGSSSNK